MPQFAFMIWAAPPEAAAKKTRHRCPRGQCQRRNRQITGEKEYQLGEACETKDVAISAYGA